MRGKISSRNLILVPAWMLVFLLATLASKQLMAQSAGAGEYKQVNLVSNGYVKAKVTKLHLVGPMGIAVGPKTPVWIVTENTNLALHYKIKNIKKGAPSPDFIYFGGSRWSLDGATGIVFNRSLLKGRPAFRIKAPSGSVPSKFVFDNLNGNISAWNAKSTRGNVNTTKAVHTPGAKFKGLALGQIGTAWYLYAADATPTGGIKVFNSSFKPTNLGSDAFVDRDLPSLPASANAVWTTHNVANLGGHIFVMYAPIHRDSSGSDNAILNSNAGVVAEFTTSGKFMRNVVVSKWGAGPLDDPWGIVMAPDMFGKYSHDLLVGNSGNGEIVAYRPSASGAFTFEGVLDGTNGEPIKDGRLRGLMFGNGVDGANLHTLYITTGGSDPHENGLFAAISPAGNAG